MAPISCKGFSGVTHDIAYTNRELESELYD